MSVMSHECLAAEVCSNAGVLLHCVGPPDVILQRVQGCLCRHVNVLHRNKSGSFLARCGSALRDEIVACWQRLTLTQKHVEVHSTELM